MEPPVYYNYRYIYYKVLCDYTVGTLHAMLTARYIPTHLPDRLHHAWDFYCQTGPVPLMSRLCWIAEWPNGYFSLWVSAYVLASVL